MQRADYTPRLNDEKKQVAFDVKIEEGPQFRFGTLTFPGLAPDAVEILTKRWRLKTGDIFDATYPSLFVSQEIHPRLRQGTAPAAFQTQVDEQNRVVNVRYVFGNATQ
jgi:outer membrane protein assembly factor BamA